MSVSDSHRIVRNLIYDEASGEWLPQTASAAGGVGLTNAELRATPVPVEATIDTTGLATDVGQTAGNNSLAAIDSKLGGTLTVAPHAVTGTFFQATQPVSGTFFQATQPVSLASVPSHAVTNAGTFAVQNTETRPATAACTNVASSATSVQLLASTAGRRGAMFYNDSTASCFVKFGTTASATSFTVKIAGGGYYEVPAPCYTGRIDAIWESANGSMRITETT